jgi:hypothetical protein
MQPARSWKALGCISNCTFVPACFTGTKVQLLMQPARSWKALGFSWHADKKYAPRSFFERDRDDVRETLDLRALLQVY